MSRPLLIAIGKVLPEDVDRDPRVTAVATRRNRAEAVRVEAKDVMGKEGAFLATIDEKAEKARSDLARFRDVDLPAVCGRVLLGEATVADEDAILKHIAEAERRLRRCELGRPSVEARVAHARARHAPLAHQVNELDLELQSVRTVVRESLAKRSLGWND